MVNIWLTKMIFLIVLSVGALSALVSASRADLGTYLNVNDFSNGLPAAEERITVDSYVLAFLNYTYTPQDGQEVHFAEEKAKYGEGRVLNVRGVLVHVTTPTDVNDHTGCSPQMRGTNGRNLPSMGKPWIALIRRGKCTFEEKVKHAWEHRAVGVIVYNEENAVNLDKMKIIEKERNITAVFTYKWIGEELAKIVDEGNTLLISISEGQRGMKPIPNINKTSVLFVSISFIVLMIISLVWLIFYYIQRFRYLQSKDKHSRQLCSVAKRIIAKIPTKNIKCDEKEGEGDCCAVCIEPYKVSDCIRVLPCKHEFHKTCIDPWLLEHRTCPMCKLDVLKHYGFVFIGSQESILQLDLGMEIDSGLHGGDDDRISIDISRIGIITPTFHIQSFGERSQLMRSSSLESIAAIQREIIPIRSQSSLSCLNPMLDDTISTKSGYNQGTSSGRECKQIHLLSPDDNRNQGSLSLPSTLRKLKSPEACRGSNNCYVRKNPSEKSCPKSKTAYIRQTSDDELLLAAERTETEVDSDQRPNESSTIQIDDENDSDSPQ